MLGLQSSRKQRTLMVEEGEDDPQGEVGKEGQDIAWGCLHGTHNFFEVFHFS